MPAPVLLDTFTPLAGEGTAPYPLTAHLADTGQGYALGPSYASSTPPVVTAAGKLRSGAASQNMGIAPTDASTTMADGIVQFDLTIGTDAGSLQGVTFRHTNNGSTDTFYTVYRSGANIALATVINGVGPTFVTGSGAAHGIANGATATIAVLFSGTSIVVLKNGSQLFAISNGAITGAGKVGFFSQNSGVTPSDGVSNLFDRLMAYPTPAPTVLPTDGGIYYSFLNWYTSGTAYRQTNNSGGYLRFTTDSGFVALSVDTSMIATAPGQGTVIRCQITDNATGQTGNYSEFFLLPGQTTILLQNAAAGTPRTFKVTARGFSGTYDRWAAPVSVLRVSGIVLDAGRSPVLPPIRTRRIAVFSDSIGEGYFANGNSAQTDSSLSWASMLAEGLNAELALVAFAGQGWEFGSNSGGAAVVPKAADSWNYYSQGKPRDLTSVQPDEAYFNWGTNDEIRSPKTADNVVTGDAGTMLVNARAAWPNTRLFIVVPVSGAKRAALLAAALPDANCFVLDPSVNLAQYYSNVAGVTSFHNVDGVHPGVYGSSILAAEIMRLRAAALAPAPGKVSTSAKTDGYTQGTRTDALAANVKVGSGGYGDPASPFTPSYAAYPLLPAGKVASGYPLGDGNFGTRTDAPVNTVLISQLYGDPAAPFQGNVGLPTEGNVLESVPYGPATALKLGQYRPPNRLWYLMDGPAFGQVGNLIGGDASTPDPAGVLNTYSFRKGGQTVAGTAQQTIIGGGGAINTRIGIGI